MKGGAQKLLIRLEKLARAKLWAIKARIMSPKDCDVGLMLDCIQQLDGALHSELSQEYNNILNNIKKEYEKFGELAKNNYLCKEFKPLNLKSYVTVQTTNNSNNRRN